MNAHLKNYIQGWLKKAENDLITAERLIEIEPILIDNACFHCQQAIEKLLKAYLTFKKKDIKKTHNIDFLLEECILLDNDFSKIDPKNIEDYAVKSRYPDESIIPSAEEAKEYYQITLAVKRLVLEKILL